MSEPERVVEKIEVEKVKYKLDIEITEKLMEVINKSKKEVEEKRGKEMGYGEYIEECIFDLIKMNDYLNRECYRLADEIEYLREQLGLPPSLQVEGEEEATMMAEEGAVVDGESVPHEEAPEHMYG
jgi:hypothetical protein